MEFGDGGDDVGKSYDHAWVDRFGPWSSRIVEE
jgi:hypothetical protein